MFHEWPYPKPDTAQPHLLRLYDDQPARAPALLRAVGAAYIVLGTFTLVVLTAFIGTYAFQDQKLPSSTALAFFVAILFGWAQISGGLRVRQTRLSGQWMLNLCAVLWLSAGLVDTLNGEADAGTAILSYLIPLTTLWVLNVRHKDRF